MKQEQLAQIAYEAHCKAIGKTPCWRCTGRMGQFIWIRVAEAVMASTSKNSITSPVTHNPQEDAFYKKVDPAEKDIKIGG